MELLAPAGGPPQFNAAIAAGADAIFCGFGHHFNARRGAESFDDESFAAACRRAHLAGTRVYVTVNVVIRTDEMERVLGVVRRAWLLGADAFIVQDWGLMDELRRRWPEVEVHVSTQANVHDARGVAWCRDHGLARRVTLSRELSMGEIATIAQEGVPLETFCHGAICICYSGICMMSSLGGGRSANRGACAQPCRLPYRLVDGQGAVLSTPERGRPLCPRDFRALEHLEELERAGVASLKVEGRLKGSDYVYAVVGVYREALDDLALGLTASREELRRREHLLRRAFNRDFTDAYLLGYSDDRMMSYERSNNRGELVGMVVATRDLGTVRVQRGGSGGGRERTRKMTVAEVDIRLDGPVGKGDLLEVRPDDDPSAFLTTHAPQDAGEGAVITCRTARPMAAGCPVRVIRSQSALDRGARVERSDVPRARAVVAHVVARLGRPLAIELATSNGVAAVRVEGPVVEPARTRAVTREDLVEHVGRMGGSAFVASDVQVDLDEGCGLGFSAIHKLRAKACRMLADELLGPYERRGLDKTPSLARIERDLAREREASETAPAGSLAPELCVLVGSASAARVAHAAGATRLYAREELLASPDWPGELAATPWLSEVCREGDHAWIDPWLRQGSAVAAGNVSQIAQAAAAGARMEVQPCIPVHNSSALALVEREGARVVWLSPELSLDEIEQLGKVARVPLGLLVLGRTRAMTTEHCVLQVAGACIDDCARCALRQRDLRIENDKGEAYPVRTDTRGRSRVYAASPLDATPELPELLDSGVRCLMVDGTLMDDAELSRAVAHVARQLKRAQAGESLAARLPGHNSGHLHRPIA